MLRREPGAPALGDTIHSSARAREPDRYEEFKKLNLNTFKILKSFDNVYGEPWLKGKFKASGTGDN